MKPQSNYYQEELIDPAIYHLSTSDINDILVNPREWVMRKLFGDKKNTSDAMKKGLDLHSLIFDEFETGDYIVTPHGKQQFRMDDPEWINYTVSDWYNSELWDEKKVNVDLRNDTVFYKGKHIVPKELARFSLADYINAFQLKNEIFNGGYAEKEFYAQTNFGNLRGKLDYHKHINGNSIEIIDLKTKMNITFDDMMKIDREALKNVQDENLTGIEVILKDKIKNYALQMFIYKTLMSEAFPDKEVSFSFCFLICSNDDELAGKSNKYYVENVELSANTEHLCIQKISKARKLMTQEFYFAKENTNYSLDNIGIIKGMVI